MGLHGMIQSLFGKQQHKHNGKQQKQMDATITNPELCWKGVFQYNSTGQLTEPLTVRKKFTILSSQSTGCLTTRVRKRFRDLFLASMNSLLAANR